MRVQDLLGVGKRAIESLADNRKVLGHLLVIDEVVRLLVVLAYFLIERGIADRSHSADAQLGECSPLGNAEELSWCQHCVEWSWRGGGLERRGKEDEAKLSNTVPSLSRGWKAFARKAGQLLFQSEPSRTQQLSIGERRTLDEGQGRQKITSS